jgi:hypothetical protein
MLQSYGRLKTFLVLLISVLMFAYPVQTNMDDVPILIYLLALALPVFTIAVNPIGIQYFEFPSWRRSPLISKNRLAAAQFAAVFLLATGLSSAISNLLRDFPVSSITYMALILGAGYSVSIPIAMALKKRQLENQEK